MGTSGETKRCESVVMLDSDKIQTGVNGVDHMSGDGLERDQTSRIEQSSNTNISTKDGTENVENANTESKDKHVSIKTLADLITVCRHRGYQIFNDKPNIPESDKLQVLPAHYYDPKAHRSDDLDPRWHDSPRSGRRSRRRRSSFRSSNSRLTGLSSSDLQPKSSVSSSSSRVHSEYSSNTVFQSSGRQTRHEKIPLDFPDIEGDIEAEKILRMRMLKKSRRRKETSTSLFDVIKMKQKQLQNGDTLSYDGQPIMETESTNVTVIPNGDLKQEKKDRITDGIEIQNKVSLAIETTVSHTNQISRNEKTIANGEIMKENIKNNNLQDKSMREKENELQTSLTDKPKSLDQTHGDNNFKPVNEDEHVKKESNNHHMISSENLTGETFTSGMLNLSQNGNDADGKDDNYNIDNLSETNLNGKGNTNSEEALQNSESFDIGNEITRSEESNDKDDPITEIQEYVIQEGDTKLVLYRLKTRTSLIQDINNKSNDKSNVELLGNSCQEVSTITSIIKDSDKNQCQVNCNSSTLDQPSNDGVNTRMSDDRSKSPYAVTGSNNCINNSVTGDVDINQSNQSDLQQSNNSQQISDSEQNVLLSASTKQTHGNKLVSQSSEENVPNVSQVNENGSHLYTDKISHPSGVGTNDINIDRCKLSHKDAELVPDKRGNNDQGFYDVNCSKLETMDIQGSNGRSEEEFGDDNQTSSIMDDKITEGDINSRDGCSDNVSTKGDKEDANQNSVIKPVSDDQNAESNKSVQLSESKKPKRSLGNGFLVSSDVESDDNDDVDKEKKEDKSKIGNDRSSSSEKKKTKEVDQGSLVQPSTSGRQSKESDTGRNKFKSAAGQVLIAARIRQSYDEERNRRASYVKEIGDTRKALRDLYRKLKNGEDFVMDKNMDTSDKQVEKEMEVTNKDDTEKTNETVYNEQSNNVEENLEQPSVNDEEKESFTSEDETDVSESHNESIKTVKDDLKSDSCVSSNSSTKGKKYNVDKKVDNEWDPNHPLYEQIKNGFKSHYMKHDTRGVNNALKSLRGDYFDTSRVSANNEYIKEARRLYPRGFRDTHKTTKKSHGKLKHNSILSENEIMHQNGSIKGNSANELEREATVVGRTNTRRNLKDKNVKTNESKTVKRKTKSDNKENTSVLETSVTSTPSEKVVPRLKPKVKPSMDADDEKLRKERKSVEKYQRLVNKTPDLPKFRNTDAVSQAKITPSNRRRTTKGNAKIPQAKFSSYQNGDVQKYNNNSDDEELDVNGELESVPVTTRESVKDKLARRASERSMCMDTRSDDVPITQAVEIVRSRQKFYNDDGEIQTKQRGHRVYKLFQEIQMIRKSADGAINSAPLVMESPDVGGSPPFLMMDYDFSTILSHRTDTDLHKFLYGSFDYGTCFKSRSLHPYSRRRDKAWNDLKQKLENRIIFNLKEAGI